MVSSLIALIVLLIIVGIVLYIATLIVDMIPMDARFKQIAKILKILVAVLICIFKAVPMVGVSL